MAHVVVTIGGRSYRMNCEDGQENHLHGLAADIDSRTADLRRSFGEIGDQRLVVMTALTIADELHAARRTVAELEGRAQAASGARTEAQAAAEERAAALEGAVERATERVQRAVSALAGLGTARS